MPKKLRLPTEDGRTEEVDVVLKEDLDKVSNQLSAGFERVVSELHKTGTAPTQARTETMPVYKCSGKDCKFSTEDIEAFIDHKIDERVTHKPAEEASPPRKRHETVEDYLNCPECYPKFEKGLVEHPKFQARFEVREKKGEQEGVPF